MPKLFSLIYSIKCHILFLVIKFSVFHSVYAKLSRTQVNNVVCVCVCVCVCVFSSPRCLSDQIRSDQSLSCVRLFATAWITARQASLSITNSRSSVRLTSIESVMPSSQLILLSPSPPAPNPSQHQSLFPMSELFAWGGQSTGVSALASFLPKKSQGSSPLEWTGWISLQSKRLSRVFSNTTVQKHQFFGTQPSSQSNSHIHTWPQGKP